MSGKRMTENVGSYGFADFCFLSGVFEDSLNCTVGNMASRSSKQIFVLSVIPPKIFLDLTCYFLRDNGISIFLAFSLPDEQEFSGKIKIIYFYLNNFSNANAGSIEKSNEEFMFLVGGDFEQRFDFHLCEDFPHFLFALLKWDRK